MHLSPHGKLLQCVCVNVYALFLSSGAVSVYVEAFDEIIQGSVAQYVSLSQKIGGDVQKHVRHLTSMPPFCFSSPLRWLNQADVGRLWFHTGFHLFRFIHSLLSFQAELIKQGFSSQRQLLLTASTSQKPSDVGQTPLLPP